MPDPVLTEALTHLFRTDAAGVEEAHSDVRALLRSVRHGTSIYLAFWHDAHAAVQQVTAEEVRRCAEQLPPDLTAAAVGCRRMRQALEQMWQPDEVKQADQAKDLEQWRRRCADLELAHARFRANRLARGLTAAPTTGEPEPAILIHEVPHVGDGQEWLARRVRLNGPDMDGLPLGHSRIGGVPDLPAGVDWPTVDGRKVPFVAQLNLADFPVLAPLLPLDGHLFVFVLADDEHRPSPTFVFLHRGPAGSLVRAARPIDDDDVFFREGEDGLYGCTPVTAAPDPAATQEPEDAARGHFFGEMQDYYGTPGEMVDHAMADGNEWIVLLEIGSNGFADMEWSDSGSLYLLIRRDALARLDFTGVVAAVCSG